jgi:hypothetical protein
MLDCHGDLHLEMLLSGLDPGKQFVEVLMKDLDLSVSCIKEFIQ